MGKEIFNHYRILGNGIEVTTNFKEYRAQIWQGGANAPTINRVHKNQIGDISWTRAGAGEYLATLAGAFPDPDKIELFFQNENGAQNVFPYWDTINSVAIATASGTDGNVAGTIIIRVYE